MVGRHTPEEFFPISGGSGFSIGVDHTVGIITNKKTVIERRQECRRPNCWNRSGWRSPTLPQRLYPLIA